MVIGLLMTFFPCGLSDQSPVVRADRQKFGFDFVDNSVSTPCNFPR